MKIRRPELLLHPNIPKPLHGLNPRSILGQEWWDSARQAAYVQNRYCCWACGKHESKDRYEKWLEAHETYEINYAAGRAEMIEVVALCHTCHSYIHSGRLMAMLADGKLKVTDFTYIIEHGFKILHDDMLQPWVGTIENIVSACTMYAVFHPETPYALDKDMVALFLKYGIDVTSHDPEEFNRQPVPWGQWRLMLNGVEYKPIHKNIADWYNYYHREEDHE